MAEVFYEVCPRLEPDVIHGRIIISYYPILIQTFRYRMTFMEKRDILRSWHNKIAPYISRHLSIKYFVEDLVSPLLHILSPPTLRPVIYSHFFYLFL